MLANTLTLRGMTMKIKWIGKYDGKNLPTVDVEVGAKELPEVTSKSAIILIPIVLLFACCVYIKKTYLGGVAFSRVDWMIGLVIALLFFPVHELIHAVSFPAGSEVIMFYTTQGLGTTCTSPMTRNRFIVVNMLPSLILGVVPLIAYMIVPRTYAFASTVLCVFSLVHVGTGYVDYLNIVHLLRLPADSKIQISGAKIYWM